MGIVRRLLGRGRTESRSASTYSDGWGVGMSGGGGATRVDAQLAQSLAAVVSCVDLICGALSSLPASIQIDTPAGRAPAPPTATAWALLARPAEHLSWPGWIAFMASQILLHGNAVARVGMDGRGAVTSLTPAPWPWLNPMVVPGAGGPQLVFEVQNQATPEAALLRLPPRLLARDCLHIRGRGDTGIIGRSAILRAAPALSNAVELQKTAAALWANGLNPSGMLTIPGTVTAEGMRRLDAFLTGRNGGSANAGRPVYADQGTTWTQIGISPGDAELLGSRAYSTAEICRIFNVPSPLIMVGATAPADLGPFVACFAQICLAPIVASLESEFDTVLPPGQHLQLDMSGLLRGSFSAAVGALAVGKQAGFLSANDCRSMLGLAAHASGDDLGTGSPPSYPADAAGVPSLAPKPGPGSPGDLPNVGTNQDEGN